MSIPVSLNRHTLTGATSPTNMHLGTSLKDIHGNPITFPHRHTHNHPTQAVQQPNIQRATISPPTTHMGHAHSPVGVIRTPSGHTIGGLETQTHVRPLHPHSSTLFKPGSVVNNQPLNHLVSPGSHLAATRQSAFFDRAGITPNVVKSTSPVVIGSSSPFNRQLIHNPNRVVIQQETSPSGQVVDESISIQPHGFKHVTTQVEGNKIDSVTEVYKEETVAGQRVEEIVEIDIVEVGVPAQQPEIIGSVYQLQSNPQPEDDVLLDNLSKSKDLLRDVIVQDISESNRDIEESPLVIERTIIAPIPMTTSIQAPVNTVNFTSASILHPLPALASPTTPLVTNSRLSNTMARLKSGLGSSLSSPFHQQHVVQSNIQSPLRQPPIQNVSARISEPSETVPITLKTEHVGTTQTQFDFSKVQGNAEYTSPEIRSLLMTSPTVNRSHEPVFVADAAQDSPIKKTQGLESTAQITTETRPQLRPHFIQQQTFPAQQVFVPQQIPLQQQSSLPQSRHHLLRHHQGVQGSQVVGTPSFLPHIQPTTVSGNHFVNMTQQFVPSQQIPLTHHIHQQPHHQHIVGQQLHPSVVQSNLGGGFQQIVGHPQGLIMAGGVQMVPPEMMDMMEMMSGIPPGAMMMEMFSEELMPPVIEVGIDEQGNEYMEVDVGVLPMMMGMMPPGMPVMMGMPEMVFVGTSELADISPQEVYEMMTGGTTRLVAGPTGRLVEVEVPQEFPLGIDAFPPAAYYAGVHPHHIQTQHILPQQVHPQHIHPQHIHPHNVYSQPQPQVYPYPHVHPHQQVQPPHVYSHPHPHVHPYGVQPPQPQESAEEREQRLLKQEMEKEQALQQKMYSQYQNQVEKLLEKRQKLLEEEERRKREEEEDEGLMEYQNVREQEYVHETVYTSVTVEQPNGNVVETNTTEEITIKPSGEGVYTFDEERIEITTHVQSTSNNQNRYLDDMRNTSGRLQYSSQEEEKVQDYSTRMEYRTHEPAPHVQERQQRVHHNESSGMKAPTTKLSKGKILQPLSFGSSKNLKSSTTLSNQIPTESSPMSLNQYVTRDANQNVPRNVYSSEESPYEYHSYTNNLESSDNVTTSINQGSVSRSQRPLVASGQAERYPQYY